MFFILLLFFCYVFFSWWLKWKCFRKILKFVSQIFWLVLIRYVVFKRNAKKPQKKRKRKYNTKTNGYFFALKCGCSVTRSLFIYHNEFAEKVLHYSSLFFFLVWFGFVCRTSWMVERALTQFFACCCAMSLAFIKYFELYECQNEWTDMIVMRTHINTIYTLTHTNINMYTVP